jgi:hypothetical protein
MIPLPPGLTAVSQAKSRLSGQSNGVQVLGAPQESDFQFRLPFRGIGGRRCHRGRSGLAATAGIGGLLSSAQRGEQGVATSTGFERGFLGSLH